MTDYALYLDASGHPDDQPYIVVAGFIATEEQWLTFEREWEDALREHGLASIFHMVDFEAAKHANRGDILEHLTEIINRRTLAHFSGFVDLNDYRKVNAIYSMEEVVGTPYAIAARGMATFVNRWKRENLSDEDDLRTFVEQGTKHQGDMDEAFRRDALSLPVTVPKSNPRVQPGDLLAWEIFHFLKNGTERRSLVNLMKDRTFYEGIMREKNLIETCKAAGAPLRGDVPPNVEFVYHSSPKRPRKRTIS
ncbi:MAG: hypothetical protein ABSG72_12330 [Candidatus Sulfotelmatobacter sp.]|jgi:hypothetical protein